jgi:hypothetical protein
VTDPVDAGPLLPECEFADDIPRDGQGCLPVGALTAASGCRIPVGECFTIYDPNTAFNTRPAHTKKEPAMTEPASPAQDSADATDATDAADAAVERESKAAPLPAPLQGPPAAPLAHVTEAPAATTAVAEIQALLPRDGSGGTGVTVLLTLIAVGGGGAAWKFYQSFAKQKHEQRMKELEIKEKKIELQDDKGDHKACEAARAADKVALEAKIASLEARLADAEKKPAPELPELPFDAEEVEQRIAELEKALKKAPSEKKPKKAKKADG